MVSETTSSTTSGGYSGLQGCLGYLVFGPLRLLCGMCGNNSAQTKYTVKRFWICQDCGEKFQDPDDLKEKLETQKKTIPFFIGYLFFAVLATIFFAILNNHTRHGDLWWLTAMGVISIVIAFMGIIVMPIRVKKLEQEYNELSSKCLR